jgi:hypothetical protein
MNEVLIKSIVLVDDPRLNDLPYIVTRHSPHEIIVQSELRLTEPGSRDLPIFIGVVLDQRRDGMEGAIEHGLDILTGIMLKIGARSPAPVGSS